MTTRNWMGGALAAVALTGLAAGTPRVAAAPLAYDGFAYGPGSVVGQAGGFGWDTGARTLGSGGSDNACSGPPLCLCPEVPTDTLVARGHSGAGWTESTRNTTHNAVIAAGLTYPGLAVSGGALKLVSSGGPPAGGWRSFRTLDTTSSVASPLVATYMTGPGGAPRETFGKGGTEIWMSFLAAMDCGGATCTSSSSSNNGGIHLFDGIGNLDVAAGQDGPKHPFEHLQLGDRNTSDFWILARTMGSCAGGSGTWAPTSSGTQPPAGSATGYGMPFDSRTHLFVLRMRFDVADPSVTPCSNGFNTSSSACSCPPGNPSCLDEISAWIDPDLAGAAGSVPVGAADVLPPTVVSSFEFDTVQVGAEGEAIDLDEIRLGTTYADVVPGSFVPVTYQIYRATRAQGLVLPANVVGSTTASAYDDVPPSAPLTCYAVDDGTGAPALLAVSRAASGGVHLAWP